MKHKKLKDVKNIELIIILILLVVIILLSINLILNIYLYNYTEDENKFITSGELYNEDDIYYNCKGYDLSDTAVCLNQQINTFYKYNISNINKQLSYDKLKEEGGVCSHWSELYYKLGKKLGFATDKIYVNMTTNKYYHMFALISDNTGYCLLEQDLKPTCVEVENDNKIEK